MLSFTAKLNNDKQVLLQWQTASQLNHAHFAVERSSDGIHWEILGYIPGDLQSHTTKNYLYTDPNPLHHQSYYRLQQRDFDGAFSYSPIVRIFNVTEQQCKVYPNPAKDYLIFQNDGQSEPMYVHLYNSLGTLVLQTKMANKEKLNLIDLPAGMYYISVFDVDNFRTNQSVQLVKTE